MLGIDVGFCTESQTDSSSCFTVYEFEYLDEVNTIEELAKVKALIGEAVKPEGYVAINDDDPVSLSILDRFKSKIIIFSREKYNKAISYNTKNGGYGVYADQDYLYIQKASVSIL